MPAFEPYPFSFAACEADAAAFRRARSISAFHPATVTIAVLQFYVKKLQQKFFIKVQARAYGAGRGPLPDPDGHGSR